MTKTDITQERIRSALEGHHKNELKISFLKEELQHAINGREKTHGLLRSVLGDLWELDYEEFKQEKRKGSRK